MSEMENNIQYDGSVDTYLNLRKQYSKKYYNNLEKILNLDKIAYEKNPEIFPEYYDDLIKSGKIENLEFALRELSTKNIENLEIAYRVAMTKITGIRSSRNIPEGLKLLKKVSSEVKKYRYAYFDTIIQYNIYSYYRDAFEYCLNAQPDYGFIIRLSKCLLEGIGVKKNYELAQELVKPIRYKPHQFVLDTLIFSKNEENIVLAKNELKNCPEDYRLSRESYIDFLKNGPTEHNIDLMKKSLLCKKEWIIKSIGENVTADLDEQGKYSFYSTLANCNENHIRMKYLKKIPKANGKLREIQEDVLDLFKKMLEITKDLGIDVISTAGTALGAIRHGGFIPWDDDVDVFMFEKDVLSLKERLLQTHTPFFITKYDQYGEFYKFRSCTHTCWIDIFTLESVVTYNNHARSYNYRIKTSDIDDPHVLNISYQAIRTSNPHVLKPIFEEKDVYPIKYVDFEDIKIPIVNNYDKFLKQLYGDYLNIPDSPKMHVVVDDYPIYDKYLITARIYLPLKELKGNDKLKWISKLKTLLDLPKITFDNIKLKDIENNSTLYRSFIRECNHAIMSEKYKWADYEHIYSITDYAPFSKETDVESKLINIMGIAYSWDTQYKNIEKSIELYKQSKNPESKQHLYDLLIKIDTKESISEAIQIITEGADSGDGRSIGRLARAYRDGKGVEKNYAKALELMKIAADKNIPWAITEYNKMKNMN